MPQRRRRNGQFAAGAGTTAGRDRVPTEISAKVREHAAKQDAAAAEQSSAASKKIANATKDNIAHNYGVPASEVRLLGKGDWDTSGLYQGPLEIAGVRLYAQVYLSEPYYRASNGTSWQINLRTRKIFGRNLTASDLADLLEKKK